MKHFSINPFESEVLGIFNDLVYIKEYDSHADSECVLIVDREAFESMVKKWLDAKSKLCELSGHFCGVNGVFYVNKYKKVKKTINILIRIDEVGEDDWKPIYKDVPVYDVFEVTDFCDMEHG